MGVTGVPTGVITGVPGPLGGLLRTAILSPRVRAVPKPMCMTIQILKGKAIRTTGFNVLPPSSLLALFIGHGLKCFGLLSDST